MIRSGNRPITRSRNVAAVASVVIAGLVGASCDDGGGDGGDAERFCGEVAANRASLLSPELVFADDIQPLLDLYRSVGDVAPLAIEREWNQLIVNYETASTVIPGDDASLQIAVATAYQSEQAAAAVNRWLNENCGIDLGPLSTVVAHS